MASTSAAADDVSEADDDYFRKWNQARRVVLSGRASRAGLAALTTLEKILRAVVDKKRRRIKCKSNTFQKLDILDGATDFLLLAGFRRPVMGEGDILEVSESLVPQSLAAEDLLRRTPVGAGSGVGASSISVQLARPIAYHTSRA